MALNEFVQTALDEEGYEEGSDGYTKYGSWYGLANADWCVMFISWCANQAGIMTTSSTGTVPNVPKMASTSAMYTWYTNNRRNLAPSMSASSPNRLQVGDIVVINTQNGGPVTDHVGIVVSVDYDAGTADVMEGNRSNKVKKVTYTNLVDSIGYTTAIRLSIFAAITRATNIYDMSGSCIVRAAHNLTATQEI